MRGADGGGLQREGKKEGRTKEVGKEKEEEEGPAGAKLDLGVPSVTFTFASSWGSSPPTPAYSLISKRSGRRSDKGTFPGEV